MAEVKKITLIAIIIFLVTIIFKDAYNSDIFNKLLAMSGNINNLRYEPNVEKNVAIGGSYKGEIDIYYNKNDIENIKPVVFFVHGGAWILGDKSEYSKIGSLLMRENYIGILPNYALYPAGTMDDMVEDIYKSILWTYNNIEEYGGDRNRLILVGHSAGAHLNILTTLKSYLGMKNNEVQLERLPQLEKLVLISGPYDFDDYDNVSNYITGTKDRVENGLIEQLVSNLTKSDDIGPTDILKKLDDNSVEDFGTPKINLFYSDMDTLVPPSSAENLIKQIQRVSPKTTINYVYNQGQNFTHDTLIFGSRTNDKEKEQMFLDLINL